MRLKEWPIPVPSIGVRLPTGILISLVMADNYLGQRMEDYRSGKLNAPRARKLTPSGQRPGHLMVKFPPINVFVDDRLLSSVGQAVIRVLVNSGCHVEFAAEGADADAAQTFAQQSGARFLPAGYGSHVAEPVLTLRIDGVASEACVEPSSCRVAWSEGADVEHVAAAVAFFCTPAGLSIRQQSVRI